MVVRHTAAFCSTAAEDDDDMPPLIDDTPEALRAHLLSLGILVEVPLSLSISMISLSVSLNTHTRTPLTGARRGVGCPARHRRPHGHHFQFVRWRAIVRTPCLAIAATELSSRNARSCRTPCLSVTELSSRNARSWAVPVREPSALASGDHWPNRRTKRRRRIRRRRRRRLNAPRGGAYGDLCRHICVYVDIMHLCRHNNAYVCIKVTCNVCAKREVMST